MSKGFFMGAAVAVGAVVLIPGVAAALGRAGRPIARAAIRSGSVAYDEFRRAGAEAYEHMEDLAAEIREEMEAERRATAQAATTPYSAEETTTEDPARNAG
jgi:hypothetical protein